VVLEGREVIVRRLDEVKNVTFSTCCPCFFGEGGWLEAAFGDFGEAAGVAWGLAEAGGEEGLNEIPSDFGADCAPAHAEDIHVIVLHALFGGEVVVDEAGADAGDLVGADGGSDAAAADGDAAFAGPGGDGAGQGENKVWVVIVGVQALGAEVHEVVAGGEHSGHEFLFEGKSAVICGYSDTHGLVMPEKWGCGKPGCAGKR
jgi:hypothetical protein